MRKSIRNVKLEDRNFALIVYCLGRKPSDISYIKVTQEFADYLFENKVIWLLGWIDKKFIRQEWINYIAKSGVRFLSIIDEKYLTEDLVVEFVKNSILMHNRMINLIPEKFRTKKVCIEVLKKTRYSYPEIPEEFKNDKDILLSLTHVNNANVLEFWPTDVIKDPDFVNALESRFSSNVSESLLIKKFGKEFLTFNIVANWLSKTNGSFYIALREIMQFAKIYSKSIQSDAERSYISKRINNVKPFYFDNELFDHILSIDQDGVLFKKIRYKLIADFFDNPHMSGNYKRNLNSDEIILTFKQMEADIESLSDNSVDSANEIRSVIKKIKEKNIKDNSDNYLNEFSDLIKRLYTYLIYKSTTPFERYEIIFNSLEYFGINISKEDRIFFIAMNN